MFGPTAADLQHLKRVGRCLRRRPRDVRIDKPQEPDRVFIRAGTDTDFAGEAFYHRSCIAPWRSLLEGEVKFAVDDRSIVL